jgi:chemotaxis protein histidine kinase CheA
MPEMKDLIAIFKTETEEHLTKLDNGLVELEKQPDNMDLLRGLNREVHTLKGAARVFGFSEIQDIAHRIEDIFEEVIGKRAVFGSLFAERIFKGLDAIRAILDNITKEKENDVDAPDICRMLEECLSATEGVKPRRKRQRGVPSAEKENLESQKKNGEGKGNGGRRTKNGRGGTENGGGRTQIREERTQNGEGKAQPQIVDRMGETTTHHPSAQMEEYIRVPLSRVDKLLYLVGEVVANRMKASLLVSQAKRLSKLSKEVQRSISSLNEVMKKGFSNLDGDVTKCFGQCDAQVQKLREQSLNLYDHVSIEAYHLDPVIDELQAKMKEIKMLPLSTIVEGFPRMVRDISSKQGKEVNLVISGEETELDKKVLDGIKTSLIHILRNCIDHGIESPEARVALGKPRFGTIKVSASHEADNVVIKIEDDGRGIDIDEIEQTALKKRLVSNHDLEEMTEKEILNIVFMNGYSTSPVVTDVSGRGMGLDIVRRDITNLKGQVLLETQKNKETKFTLVLPLTIAVIHALLVKVQNMLFALPMLSIVECVKVKMDDVSTLEGRMAIQFREQVVPLVRLDEVIELPHAQEEGGKAKNEMSVLIATYLDRWVGLIVDEIVGEEEVFIKSLGRHLGKVKHVSGAVIMPSGEVVVVLDVTDLISHSALNLPSVTGKRKSSRVKRGEKRILIVEDIFSTRELEKSILETHGYLVDTAVDGLDALDRMTNTKYDLVVSDIEMPRMDGFELCRMLKKKEETKDIPFVMVTALQKEEDKRRGIEVGAAAYIVKSTFEQTNLLDAIERLVG